MSRVTRLVLGCAPLVLPALVAGWLLAGLPLLLLGGYRPLPATLLCLPAAALLAWAVSRRSTPLAGPAWAGWLTLAVVAGFLVLAWGWSSEHVVLRRDAGSYGLYAQWLAAHGRLPVPASASVFGPGVGFASPGFYADGGSVVPQFLSGTPMLLAVGGWLDGMTGILHADAVIGATALIAVAGLAARVAGPGTAPFVALGVGLCYPVLHAARSPYSEPLALLLLFGGLALLAERRLLLGGLLAGLATLARIDAPADLLLLVPFAVLAAPMAGAGIAAGIAVGLLDGLVLSRPYVASLAGQLLQVATAAVLLLGAALVVRRRWRGGRLPAWLPIAGAGLVVAAGLASAVRPLVEHVHRATNASGLVGALQQAQGLAREPTRTYDEQALHWVAWWLGWPTVVLAVIGLAELVRRHLRADRTPYDPAAYDRTPYDPAAFLLVLAAAAFVVLYRPSITPDHPWADRRLVPVLLPGLAICSAWLLAQLPLRWAALGAVAALLPVGLATIPLLGAATERGQLAAVRTLCERLGPRTAVVVTGSRARNELPQTLRGVCGLPVAVIPQERLASTLPGVAAAVRRSGRSLTVVAMSADVLTAAGLSATRVVELRTREDARLLVRRPSGTAALRVEVWLARAP